MDGNLILKINDSVSEKAMTYANQRGVNLSAVVEDFLFRLASGPNAKAADDVQKRKASRQLPERFKSLKGSLADADKGDVEDVRLKYLLEKYK